MKTTAIGAALLLFVAARASGQGCWPQGASSANGCPHFDSTTNVCWLDVEELEGEEHSPHAVVHLKKNRDRLAFCTSDGDIKNKFKIWKFTELQVDPDHPDCGSPAAQQHDPFPDHYPINGDVHGTSKKTRIAAIPGCFKTTLQRKRDDGKEYVDPHIIIDPELNHKKDGGKKSGTTNQAASASDNVPAAKQCPPATAAKTVDPKTHCPHDDANNHACWVRLEEKEYFAKGHPAIHLKADADKIAFCTTDPKRPFRVLEFREMDPKESDCSRPLPAQRDPFQGEHYPKHDKRYSEKYEMQKTTAKASREAVGGCFKTTIERPDRSVIDPHIIIDQ